jgi:2,4-dienoyl-CoA reductase (NADPH2)
VDRFPHQLAPGRIGAMTVCNRGVMSPMETMHGPITLGANGVDNRHPETPGGLHLATDGAVDAHRALVDAIGDCNGLGLIRKAIEDGARAVCAI